MQNFGIRNHFPLLSNQFIFKKYTKTIVFCLISAYFWSQLTK